MSKQMQNGDIRPVRRSGRTRSTVERYEPAFTRPQPSKPNTQSRARSRSRDANYYNADDVPQAPRFTQLKNSMITNSFSGGVIRVPLIHEVMKISINVIDMRWKEIHFIQDAIRIMKQHKISEDLIQQIQAACNTLEWEMNERNVEKRDLPPLGPETTIFTDISTWTIFYYDLLHENHHRIIDLTEYFMNAFKKEFTKDDKKVLMKYQTDAKKVIDEFVKNVDDFNLQGESKVAYLENIKEIKKNCPVCPQR